MLINANKKERKRTTPQMLYINVYKRKKECNQAGQVGLAWIETDFKFLKICKKIKKLKKVKIVHLL